MLTLQSNRYEGRYLELTVSETGADAARRVHTLAWTLKSTGGISSRYYVADTTVTIGGVQVYAYDAPYWSDNVTFPFPITTGSVSGTLEVPHGDSVAVTLSTKVYVSMTPEAQTGHLLLSSIGSGGGTGQGASIDMAENGVLGSNLAVQWTPTPGRTYTLSYILGRTGSAYTEKKSIHRPTAAAPYRGLIPLDYALAESIPNGIARELDITLTTYASDTLAESSVLGRDTITVTVTVPEDDATRPVITAGTCLPSPDLLAGAFLQGKTGAVPANITAGGRFGATIAKTYLRCEGENYDGPSRPIAQWGRVTLALYALDSRGFLSQPYPVAVEVLPYLNPKLRPPEGRSRVSVQRCGADGQPQEKGAYLTIAARRSYSPVVLEGSQRNFCAIRFRCRPSGGTWGDWTQILAPQATGDEVTTGPLLGSLDPALPYEVQLQALDTLGGESTMTVSLASDRIYWHRDGRLGSLGFGQTVAEEDVFLIGASKTLKLLGALSLGGEAAQALLDLAHPVGSILETVSPESPEQTLGGSWVTVAGSGETTRWRRNA